MAVADCEIMQTACNTDLDLENNHSEVNISINTQSKEDEKASSEDIHKENISKSLENFNYNSTQEMESDNEAEEVFQISRKKIKKSRVAVIDSDSENEEENEQPFSPIETDQIQTEMYRPSSDNDDENKTSKPLDKKLRRIAVIDDDSEDEDSKKPKEDDRQIIETDQPSSSAIFVIDNKGELVEENEKTILKSQKKILSNLCDPESSDEASDNAFDEEQEENISDDEVNNLQNNEIVITGPRKGRTEKISNEEKEKKMTAKKALEDRKEIMAEAQRRTREADVYLPYHKPKIRSLKEFLENRPKLAVSVKEIPQSNLSSVSVKLSKEQLKVVTHKISERVKEVEEFYKSDSESEEEINENPESNIEEDGISQSVENNIDIENKSIPNCNDINEEETNDRSIDNCENGNSKNIDELVQNDEIPEKSAKQSDTLMPITNNNNEHLSNIFEKDGTPLLEHIYNLNQNTNQNNMNSEMMTKTQIPEIMNETQMDTVEESTNEIEESSHKKEQEINIEVDAMDATEYQEQIEHNFEIDQNNSSQEKTKGIEKTEDLQENTTIISEKPETMNTMNHKEIKIIENDENKILKEQLQNEESIKTDEKNKQIEVREHETNLNLSKTSDKLTIISDIVVTSGITENTENKYNLDVELLELEEEPKNNSMEASESYEFNLDDLNDDDDAHNMDLDETGERGVNRIEKMTNRTLKKVESLRPRLSGGPNQVIDLENGVILPDEIALLRERFLQHNSKTTKHKHKKNINIISVSDGEIHRETLAVNVDEDEENTAPIEKPGVRLQKLRDDLTYQIAQKRSELWKEKLNKQIKKEDDDKETDGEKSDCDMDKLLDDEEEEDMTESEEEYDEELEENDCDMTEKKKKKSAFLDEEAQESDIEENEIDEKKNKGINEEEDIEEMNEEMHEEEEEGDNGDVEDNEEMEELENQSPKKRILKRIIKPFEDDDSDDDDNQNMNQKNQLFELLGKKRVDDLNSDDEFLPPHQLTNYKTREPILTPTISQTDFLTPVTFMTGLKNLNTSGSRVADILDISQDNDPPAQPISQSQSQSDDFGANFETATGIEANQISTQNDFITPNSLESGILNTQDVLDICSGNFPSSSKTVSSPEISTQQLKEIFTGSDSDVPKFSGDFNTQDLAEICSGKFTDVSQKITEKEKETVLDENDEYMISQLIDEEELERFKKKFESPVASATQKTINFEEVGEVLGNGGVIDSDGDDDELKLKKTRRKRIAFSDEEDSDEEEEEANEEIVDLQDNEGLEEDDIEYDSEENEVDENKKQLTYQQLKEERMKASEFFEKEAELSESDWDSEDEDEKNLDDMEFEKGDEDKFDNDQLRSDIEKIQMRQMLDEDNREVKLLQELLLEDGELHGSGRQRQFRWKNIDAAGNDVEENKKEDGEVHLYDDDESEEQWRKSRHEREMFMLKKQSQREEELMDNQSLSFTHKSLKIKSQSSIFSQTILSEETVKSPKVKQAFSLLNRKGSFLSRSEQMLQKFAETTKVSLNTKNSNRIVFQAVDDHDRKRKASSLETESEKSTPFALKKLRLSGLSPALKKTKPKSSKSLFPSISVD